MNSTPYAANGQQASNGVDTTIDLALKYAALGYSVLPLHSVVDGRCTCHKKANCDSPGKHPRTEHGAKDATSDEATINTWFKRWPNANLGMTLNGLVVVDVDPRNGGVDTFDDLVAQHGGLPYTWTQATGGGGSHHVFRANGAAYPGSLGPGVDLKHGANSFIVVEPSIHATGKPYIWLDENGPFENGVLADAPDWLAPAPAPKATASIDERGGKIAEGGRNEALSKLAYKLRKGGLGLEDLTTALLVVNKTKFDPPLPDNEVKAIAAGKNGIEADATDERCEPELLDLMTLSEIDPKPTKFIVADRLPAGAVTMLAGHGGTAKSSLALFLAVCIALGQRFYGAACEQHPVLFYSSEDPLRILHWRLVHICRYLGVSIADLEGQLFLYDGTGLDNILYQDAFNPAERLTQLYLWLRGKVAEHKAEMLILDSASDFYDASENDRAKVKAFVNMLLRLVKARDDGAVLLLAHVNRVTALNSKTTEGYSGSTGWHNACRARWYLRFERSESEDTPPSEDTPRLLEFQKSNWGRQVPELRLLWDAKANVLVPDQVPGEGGIVASIRHGNQRKAILSLLAECERIDQRVASGPKANENAAIILGERKGFPAEFHGHKGKAKLFTLLRELQQAGLIREDTVKNASRHPVGVWVLTDAGRGEEKPC